MIAGMEQTDNAPTKMYRCLACDSEWTQGQVVESVRFTSKVLTCGDLFCGGTVIEFKEPE